MRVCVCLYLNWTNIFKDFISAWFECLVCFLFYFFDICVSSFVPSKWPAMVVCVVVRFQCLYFIWYFVCVVYVRAIKTSYKTFSIYKAQLNSHVCCDACFFSHYWVLFYCVKCSDLSDFFIHISYRTLQRRDRIRSRRSYYIQTKRHSTAKIVGFLLRTALHSFDISFFCTNNKKVERKNCTNISQQIKYGDTNKIKRCISAFHKIIYWLKFCVDHIICINTILILSNWI